MDAEQPYPAAGLGRHLPGALGRAARSETLLAIVTAVCAITGLVVTVIWAAIGIDGEFWPGWVWLCLTAIVAVEAAVRDVMLRPRGRRLLRLQAELTAIVSLFLIGVRVLHGSGPPWPIYPIAVLTGLLAVHALISYRDRWLPNTREQVLERRVDELTRTRRGALDVQAEELRRIERDLHDGAQARLVALSIHLGRAEDRLDDRPEVAELLRQARAEASAAIAELRDLARGIAPPVLVDRGLAAAVDALAQRSATPVSVDATVAGRLPAVVETAAYFVVAEALTNAAKHADGAKAHVRIVDQDRVLVVEVSDDGPGGADAGGGGLTGLRHRVEALDGRLTITSPPGGGTTVRAELPCES
jgi:signal transduction histidine kinase